MTDSSHRDDLDLMAYADGELTPETRAKIQEHVTACPDCRSRLDQWQELILQIGTGDDEAHSVDVRPAVMRSLRREHATRTRISWLLVAELAAGGALSAALLSVLRQAWLAALSLLEPILARPVHEEWWSLIQGQISAIPNQLAQSLEVVVSRLPSMPLDAQIILSGWPWLVLGGLAWLLVNGVLISGRSIAQIGPNVGKREPSG